MNEQLDIKALKRNHDLSDWEPCFVCPDAYGNHFSCRQVESCAKCECSEFIPFSRYDYAKLFRSQQATIERYRDSALYIMETVKAGDGVSALWEFVDSIATDAHRVEMAALEGG